MSQDASTKGFVAIYRWRVAPEHEAEFRDVWADATRALRAKGGLGSLLGRAADGTFCAIALWPSAEARERAFAETPEGRAWPPSERLEPIALDVIEDLWAVSGLPRDAH